jgi:hypothetical protein
MTTMLLYSPLCTQPTLTGLVLYTVLLCFKIRRLMLGKCIFPSTRSFLIAYMNIS